MLEQVRPIAHVEGQQRTILTHGAELALVLVPGKIALRRLQRDDWKVCCMKAARHVHELNSMVLVSICVRYVEVLHVTRAMCVCRHFLHMFLECLFFVLLSAKPVHV